MSIDAPLAKAAATWTAGIEKIPASASSAQLDAGLVKVSPAYSSAIGTFDRKLAALHLPGKAGSDAALVVTYNKQLVALLAIAHSISKSAFTKGFGPIAQAQTGLQETFRADLGLPASAAIQI